MTSTTTPIFERFGVRPNLNKKGFITLHPVGPNNGVDYSHAAYHLDKYVLLRFRGVHVSACKENAIRLKGVKQPCACVIGDLIGVLDTLTDTTYWDTMPRIKYDPFETSFTFDEQPEIGDFIVAGYDRTFIWRQDHE